jgi:hypothetical protein
VRFIRFTALFYSSDGMYTECCKNRTLLSWRRPVEEGEPFFHWVIYDAVRKPVAIAVVTNKVKKIRWSFNIEIPDYPVKRT